MYPSPVVFVGAEAGDVVLTWKPVEGATSYLVYRSERPVPPEETEAFYAGDFGPAVRSHRLAPAATAVADRPAGAAWYLVLATDAEGNLIAVDFSVEPAGERLVAVQALVDHQHHSVYDHLPELIYRKDDPNGRMSMVTMARGLGKSSGDS